MVSVVPTVNLPHLDVLAHQRKTNSLDRGFIVCNSNCAVVGLVVPMAALQARFGPIECCSVVTMQAVWLFNQQSQLERADECCRFQVPVTPESAVWTSLTTLYLLYREKRTKWRVKVCDLGLFMIFWRSPSTIGSAALQFGVGNLGHVSRGVYRQRKC